MRYGGTGQATVEWSALVLIVALALTALAWVVSRTEAWRLGDAVLQAIVCAAGDGCPDALEDAYGEEIAGMLRRFAPNIVYESDSAQLPVDFRRCREVGCSNGSDRAEEIDRSAAGLPVTAFTRVVDRRAGSGPVYLQFWLYFPESFSGGIGRAFGKRWPGEHADDWEGVQLRIEPGGAISARATAHGGYRSAKDMEGWGKWSGWYRVSGGSHAGHLVNGADGERTTHAPSLRLVPLESLNGTGNYSFAISPPWSKDVYTDPEAASS
jgi:hypothetical protein